MMLPKEDLAEAAGRWMGIPVFVSDLLGQAPVLAVRNDCPMTDGGRIAMNDWLRTTFGVKEQVLRTPRGIFMSRAGFNKLRQAYPARWPYDAAHGVWSNRT